jgi:phenylalanyl-tRNA synthetase alpha chain
VKNELEHIRQEAIQKISAAKTPEVLRDIEIEYLGRKQGKLALLLREVPKLPDDERPEMGKFGNIIKNEITDALAQKMVECEEQEETGGFFDYSAPSKKRTLGKIHPISRFIREAEDVFGRLGFDVADGPEVDDEHHNFNALNIPEHHPAREMQDTFWVKNLKKHVLRTQTSNVQIHFMEQNEPPFRIIAPGKVFRKDSDATHSPMFHQIEGLMVDKDISLAHLKFVLLCALRELLSADLELRFRLSYFPFTEPSLEVDASCPICSGKNPDCKVCKGTGWLEIGGAGMVHPNVLKNVGLDPKEWNGFAFGFGIERQVMIRHQIDDLRQFYENDLRFLEQF